MLVWLEEGSTPYIQANRLMPMNISERITPIAAIVALAFTSDGSRNTLTPLAIASMPVMAEQPEEKARRIRNRPSGATAFTGGIGSGWKPCRSTRSTSPKPTSRATMTMKA